MNWNFLKKKKFWMSVVGALAAAGLLSPAYSNTVLKIITAILGG